MNKRIKKKHKKNTYQNQYKNGWDVIGIAIFFVVEKEVNIDGMPGKVIEKKIAIFIYVGEVF